MLGLLARHELNRAKILSALSGGSDTGKLDGLIEVIKDFIGLHTRVTAKMAMLIERAKQAEGDEAGDDQDADEAGDASDVLGNSVALANSLHSGQRDYEAVNAVLESLVQIRQKMAD